MLLLHSSSSTSPQPLHPHYSHVAWNSLKILAILCLCAFAHVSGLGFLNFCVSLENSPLPLLQNLSDFPKQSLPPDLHVLGYSAHASILALGKLVEMIIFLSVPCRLWYLCGKTSCLLQRPLTFLTITYRIWNTLVAQQIFIKKTNELSGQAVPGCKLNRSCYQLPGNLSDS